MILFVDCDNTLLLWDDSETQMNADQSLWRGDKYKFNKPLIDAILTWREKNTRDSVIVWSGGGREYAERWANLTLPGEFELAISKNIQLPTDYDICIDDEQLKVNGKLLTAEEFIKAVVA